MNPSHLLYWRAKVPARRGRAYSGPTHGAWIYRDGTTRVFPFTASSAREIVDSAGDAVAFALGRGEASTATWSSDAEGPNGRSLRYDYGEGKPLPEAVGGILKALEAAEQEWARVNETSATRLAYELSQRDWTADYSDDHSVWMRAHEHTRLILDLLSRTPREEARAVWERVAPAGYPFPERYAGTAL